jgi:RNA polymerase primary sigma factor
MYHKNDPMKVYMQDIGEIPLITKLEEVELAAKIKVGDELARQKLIKANLRLVVKIAHDFKGFGLPLLDLISEGNIGLMRAAEKFDPAKGAKFSSYSAWWIKQSMRRALSQKSRTIRVPVASAGKINKIRTAKIQLAEKLGRVATDTEIAEHLDFTKRTVQGLKLADLKTFSLHDPIQKGEEGSFEDIIPDSSASTPDEIIEDTESIQRLRGLIHNLDEREKTILIMRYGLDGNRPKTLEEVSRIIGRTRERVRQIQMQSLKKLKAMIDDETFDNDGKRLLQSQKSQEEGWPSSDAAGLSNNGKRMAATDADDMKKASGGRANFRTNGRSQLFRTMSKNGQPLIDAKIRRMKNGALGAAKAGLSTLKISTRSMNSLRSVGVRSVAELASKSPVELLGIRFFGEKCLAEAQLALAKYYKVSNHR